MTRRSNNLLIEGTIESSEEISTEMFTLSPIKETDVSEEEMLASDGLFVFDSVQEENFKLFSAVNRKESQSVQRVLQDGANVNAQSSAMFITVLHIASANGDENILTMLLAAGADPNAEDKFGRTPLHMAASVGSEACIALLLRNGAKPNYVYQVNTWSNKNYTLKQKLGFKNGYGRTVSLEGLGLNIPSPECLGRTPLHQAVKANSPECVRRLLEAGANVDPKDECGITPLLLAGVREKVKKYEELVDVLLEYRADPNIINEGTGEAALHCAINLDSVKATKSLLDHCADPTISSEAGGHRTAVHVAAYRAASEILMVILESEEDESARQILVNKVDIKGHTPLHLAAHTGCHDCVSILIDAGADLGATTNDGISALDDILLWLPRPAQFLAHIFDGRVLPNTATVNDRSFTVQLDFRPLAPHGNVRQTGVMKALLEAEAATDNTRRLLLSHPLVEAFIVLKWRRLRLFFYFLVSVYVSFALSLSVYITLIHCDIQRSPLILHSIAVSRRVLYFSSSVVLLNVIGQCVALPRYYLRQFEIWMNLVTGLLSIVVALKSQHHGDTTVAPHTILANRMQNSSDLETRINLEYDEVNPSHSWVLHVTSVTILFSWAELMLLIGRFPTWGSHALLFYAVLRNVLKVLLAFGCLILGFSFSFFVQFHKGNRKAFGDPWKAFVNTMVMMMGEFQYLDLFEPPKDGEPFTFLLFTSRAIFVCFVVLASIVLVNLMVGLAVSDTQALRSEGEARRLLKQAGFVSHLERGVAAVISSKWLPKRLLNQLEKRRTIPTLVKVRPSDAAVASAHRAGRHLSRRLLDDLVTIALRTRADECKRSQSCNPDGSAHSDRSMDSVLPKNYSLLLALESLARDISEVKDMLELRSVGEWNPAASAVRARKWSSARVPRGRFSNLVTEVTGAQNMLKRLSLMKE